MLPGTYYYSSGYVNTQNNIFMQGAITVKPIPDNKKKLYISVGGIEAKYKPSELHFC